MRSEVLVICLGILGFASVTEGAIRDVPLEQCQQLAHDYAEDPSSLKKERLKQLQFCINQTLRQQEAMNPPAMLQGTIIEPLKPSGGFLS